MSTDMGKALPKFGEWDVNDPATAEGFTVIFNKARDEKKTTATGKGAPTKVRNDQNFSYPTSKRKSWFCCA